MAYPSLDHSSLVFTKLESVEDDRGAGARASAARPRQQRVAAGARRTPPPRVRGPSTVGRRRGAANSRVQFFLVVSERGEFVEFFFDFFAHRTVENRYCRVV